MKNLYFSVEAINEAACKIAEKHGITVYISEAVRSMERAEVPAEFKGFDVRPVATIHSFNNGEYWEARYRGLVVKVGDSWYNLGHPHNKKCWRLWRLGPDCPGYNYNDLRGLESKFTAPNLIGKPTEKKMRDWAEYLDNTLAEEIEYITRNRSTEQRELAIIAQNPGAEVNRDKAGNISSVVVRSAGLRVVFYPQNGVVYSDYSIDSCALPAILQKMREGKC